ncbi:MAG TPA: lytic transglycosylase domain-containing protein [Bryobacteraceae bacterium]|nr:lytic transglycosylase domain-containing protein [Bryobacteraceae bacterium]
MAWIMVLLAAAAAAARQPDGARAAAPAGGSGSVAQQQASIARQRASIRQQAANVSQWMLPWEEGPPPIVEPAAPPACDPIADQVVAPLIDSAAKANAVEPKLIRAVMEQESGLRPCAISAKGAQGLMQLMPETAQELQVQDAFDPAQNVQAGAKYLKQLLDKYGGDVAQALAAYNAGPNTVDQSGGVPDIPETRGYVDSILEKLGIKRPPPPP